MGGKGYRYEPLSEYFSSSSESEKRIEYGFLNSLGDKPELGKSHVAFGNDLIGNRCATRAYYDYRNELLYVEKTVEVAWRGMCNYSPRGKLLRTAFQNNELEMFFSPQKELITRCARVNFCSSENIPFPN